jgi:hypothetical protein
VRERAVRVRFAAVVSFLIGRGLVSKPHIFYPSHLAGDRGLMYTRTVRERQSNGL